MIFRLGNLYLEQLRSGQMPGRKAEGEVVFSMAGSDMPDVGIPKGSRLWARDQTGRKLSYEVEEDAVVSFNPEKNSKSARITALETGSEGSLPAGTEFKLMKSMGLAARAVNPYALYGGCGMEEQKDADARGTLTVRHRKRAVTACDFENLVLEAGRNVERIKCFSNYNEKGEHAPKAVTVVVLHKDYEEGRRFFYQIKGAIYRYFSERTSRTLTEGAGLYVTAPWFVWLDVTVELVVERQVYMAETKEAADEALKAYINPVTGGPDGCGWKIGQLPDHKRLRHVSYIKRAQQLLLSASI